MCSAAKPTRPTRRSTDYLAKHAGDPQADFISFQIATELFKRKDYQGALQSAQRSLHDFPKGRYVADATLLESRALTALGRIEESNDVVEDFLKNNSTSPVAYGMILSRAANEAADGNLPAALADYGKIKDATAAGLETQSAADAGYIQTLQRMKKFDEVIAEAKNYESKYSGGGKALPVVMLFAAQALNEKHDPGAVAALQEVARKFPQDPSSRRWRSSTSSITIAAPATCRSCSRRPRTSRPRVPKPTRKSSSPTKPWARNS